MIFYVSLIIAVIIMVIGLSINYYWYQKQGKKLFMEIADRLNSDELFFMILGIALIVIVFLVPLINIIFAISVNVGLFIKGVE